MKMVALPTISIFFTGMITGMMPFDKQWHTMIWIVKNVYWLPVSWSVKPELAEHQCDCWILFEVSALHREYFYFYFYSFYVHQTRIHIELNSVHVLRNSSLLLLDSSSPQYLIHDSSSRYCWKLHIVSRISEFLLLKLYIKTVLTMPQLSYT